MKVFIANIRIETDDEDAPEWIIGWLEQRLNREDGHTERAIDIREVREVKEDENDYIGN